MSYPSIITQPGSALRNLEPITQAVAELLDDDHQAGENPLDQGGSSRHPGPVRAKRRVLEIGSGDCTHLAHWAGRWQDMEWWPTGRNEEEVQTIDGVLGKDEHSHLTNVMKALELDIGIEDSWAGWEQRVRSSAPSADEQGGKPREGDLFDGVLMINIIHCCPVGYPENVFRHFSPTANPPNGPPLLNPKHGWIAAYSPFLADDGSYKSEGDEKVSQALDDAEVKFDREYIRAKDDSLGLRSIKSISDMAARRGFKEVLRKEMPRGNMWVVWAVA